MPNINRWAGRRGRPIEIRKTTRPDDPINLLAAAMGDGYTEWYQSLPLAIAGKMSVFRQLCEEKLLELAESECVDDGARNCVCGNCNPPSPAEIDDDEVVPFDAESEGILYVIWRGENDETDKNSNRR